MTQTSELLLAGGAIAAIGAAVLYSGEKAAKVEAEEQAAADEFYEELIDDSGLTPEVAQRIAMALPAVTTQVERVYWKTAMRERAAEFLGEYSYSELSQFQHDNLDAAETRTMYDQLTISDINSMCIYGPLLFCNLYVTLFPQDAPVRTLFVSTHDQPDKIGFLATVSEWVTFVQTINNTAEKRWIEDGRPAIIVAGLKEFANSFFDDGRWQITFDECLKISVDFDEDDPQTWIMESLHEVNSKTYGEIFNADEFVANVEKSYDNRPSIHVTTEQVEELVTHFLEIEVALQMGQPVSTVHAYYDEDTRQQMVTAMFEKIEEVDSFSMTHPERITLPGDMVPKSIEDFKRLLQLRGDTFDSIEKLNSALAGVNSVERAASVLGGGEDLGHSFADMLEVRKVFGEYESAVSVTVEDDD